MPVHGSGGGGNVKNVEDYPNDYENTPEHQPHPDVFSRFLNSSKQQKESQKDEEYVQNAIQEVVIVKFGVHQQLYLVPGQGYGHNQINNSKNEGANAWRNAAHGIQHDDFWSDLSLSM